MNPNRATVDKFLDSRPQHQSLGLRLELVLFESRDFYGLAGNPGQPMWDVVDLEWALRQITHH